MVLLIRTAYPNVESIRLSEWTTSCWLTMQFSVPKLLSLLNYGPWKLTTRCGCTIQWLARILVYPHINSGADIIFFPERRFYPPDILGVLLTKFYNLSFRNGGLISPNGNLTVIEGYYLGSAVFTLPCWVSYLTFILGTYPISTTLYLMKFLQPLPPHTIMGLYLKYRLTW